MLRTARDDGETVHQAAHRLSDAAFPRRPPCLDTQVSRVQRLAVPATGTLLRSGVRCVMPIGGPRTTPHGAGEPL